MRLLKVWSHICNVVPHNSDRYFPTFSQSLHLGFDIVRDELVWTHLQYKAPDLLWPFLQAKLLSTSFTARPKNTGTFAAPRSFF